MALRVEYFPYQPFASRVWDLRANVPAYDAWYVALAESLGPSSRRSTAGSAVPPDPGVASPYRLGSGGRTLPSYPGPFFFLRRLHGDERGEREMVRRPPTAERERGEVKLGSFCRN